MREIQQIRLADVLLIGPFMIYASAVYMEKSPEWSRLLMGFLGVGTILYNATNYISEEISPPSE